MEGTFSSRARGLAYCLVGTLGFLRSSHAAPCIADSPPNDQPANSQPVPSEFCLAGAAGQHYYYWQIPDAYSGRSWTIKLQALPGENTILVVQSIDQDPHKGPFKVQTLWQGKSSGNDASIASPSLLLKPGLYGIVAATEQAPGLFRLFVAADTATSAPPGSTASAPQTVADAAAPSATNAPVLERTATAGDAEIVFPWTIDAAATRNRWMIVLQTTAGASPNLRIIGPDGKPLFLDRGRVEKAGVIHYPELALEAGTYKIGVSAKSGAPLTLRVFATGTRDATHVTGPNMVPESAFEYRATTTISGVFAEKGGPPDKQYVAMVVDDSLKDKRFDLVLKAGTTHQDHIEFKYFTPKGDETNTRGGVGEARLTNVSLPKGTYVFALNSGPSEDLPYTFGIENIAPRAPGEEQEPNDSPELATLMPADGTISGQSDGDGDWDFFRVHVVGPTKLWKISCECKGVGQLALHGGNGDNLIVFNDFPNDHAEISGVLLAPGDHLLHIRSTNAHYVLHVTPQAAAPAEAGGKPAPLDAPLTAVDEIEPNDEPATAMPLALNSSRGGVNDHPGDLDYYRFTLLGFTRVRLTLVDPGTAARHAVLGWGSDQRPLAQLATPDAQGSSVFDGILAAGDYYVMVKADSPSSAPYRIKLESRDPFGSDASATLPVQVRLKLTQSHVAAFVPDAQTLTGTLELKSQSTTPLDLNLLPYVSDERWRASADVQSVHLDANGTMSIPVSVQVASEVRSDHPVQVGYGLKNATGAHVAALTFISADDTVAAVAPQSAPSIPLALAGGFDVAWSALGGQSRDAHPLLIDGLFNQGSTLKLTRAEASAGLSVALAGNSPVTVLGLAIYPAGSVPTGDRLRHFKVSASTDGTQYTEILSAQLSPRADRQFFTLPKPASAKYVRLDPIDSQDAKAASIALAEFQVFADPKSAPFGTTGLEISPLLRGGHVVWMDPFPTVSPFTAQDHHSMLSAQSTRATNVGWSPSRTEPLSWVIGFLDDMPARIESLSWVYAKDQPDGNSIPSVDVSVSTTSPRGPFTPLGTWKISAQGDSVPFKPTTQPLIRYLRFVAAKTRYGNSADLPLHLSVKEAPVSPDYHSVLALPLALAPSTVAMQDSPVEPTRVLLSGTPGQGWVRLGKRVDHWTFDMPAASHDASFVLNNPPTLGAQLTLKGPDGKLVALQESSPSPDTRRYQASITPGHYSLEVSEPPRSVAISWDTSESVRGWLPGITAAVLSVAQDAAPGREEMNLFPFHDPIAKALLDDFTGDPAMVFGALQSYDWKDGSSSAEAALLGASQALNGRAGRRGIILLTDAETSSLSLTADLWHEIDRTGAQVFSLSVPTSSTGEDAWKSRNLMTDWAAASGGFSAMIGDQGDVEAAFQRAAAEMRTGSAYTLTATLNAPPPAPGKLSVTLESAKPGAPAAPSETIALLLDASGSMLQKIKGRQKIDIARSELEHLVRDIIPEATPITLRVYGQGGRGSCRSDLMMPLAALDRQKAEAIVTTIRSTDGARTATAASLHLVAQDLAGAQGAKRVILITDGEENCGGNVETEISALHKAGFDVELDIVGFAIDSPAVGKMFGRWAQLGGGKYIESKDAATLDQALAKTLQPTFEVLDTSSAIVGTGTVGGESIVLPAGRYSVRLKNRPAVSVAAEVKPAATATALIPR